ncbi:YajQ family cyclic di-GMP-binding protein [Aeromonas simiae]|uniref:Nucleotide-binding protein FE240_12430 n=1 Tax=Aeromonas simiae TaxID=218936 RepID=A0A5J6WW60_9GAMM|nr:YajQ family cyclic di-GMP-binding protein [Aeromonas simiae]MDO2947148.1 YajQ family cyclic di-GMP-binding protein [Aeromonas simiae]MDO2950760.1 YajQ family cyclic di-GMP-binding protein [Aeromonas simiae]MDO2954258.1 YajQ family cyclic di-GMP-binding protein [Aeromonas simiae]QFI55419.1 YajQ family cyclic di-GMP-binding protein [Aeromonas simiae]
MPSFDIVSEVKMNEVLNAVDNANRELSTRFDFRGVEASFTLSKEVVKLEADADFQLKQMVDILREKLIKRGIETNSMTVGDSVHSGKRFSLDVSFKQGLEKEAAKKLVKLIKDSKLKVQAAIQGEEVRVTGKKRDDLQEVIALLRATEFEQPLQYQNFRD